MKFVCLALCSILLGLASQAADTRRNPETWKWIVPEKIDGCIHGTVFSKSMNREIGYHVFLPPSYAKNSEKEYPVVYYLHGAGGSEASAKAFVWAVRGAIRAGKIGDVIYVFPNGGTRSGYRDWPDGKVKAETWIIKELIPHIDRTYRTISSREGRALTGWSMGGGGSLRFAMKYPEKFCAAATMAAALTTRVPSDPADTAPAHLEKNLQAIRGRTGLWMAVGEEDFLYKGNVAFSERLKDLKVEHTFHTVPGVGHKLGELNKRFAREVVAMLAESYAAARSRTSRNTIR